ncbi:MAG: glycosyltransferase [Candidatus Edwardsbacteria bacterium]|nr:glycosyltransferase [Candidatus Edwardsbacteria bacterium]MBU1577256.1 glycosyltransferase [Candidatus Edwardsbacteria bacterium]MBU2463862.1 glycosyltransferase [Candidatus Edwardsbacteria bacterium]MBU2594857.1 glycosyltransferase [Candidatus Edwardsbacteria bacterium]
MDSNLKNTKIAIVHDYLNQYGGAERVLESLHGLFPEAPIYTLLHDPDMLPGHFRGWDIRPSFLNRLPGHRRHYQKLLALFPLAVESFDLNDYDIVISSSNAWAKGAITTSRTFHLCYVHTPMRFVWDWYHYISHEHNAVTNLFLIPFLSRIRLWDECSCQRPDFYVSNSMEVQRRIAKYYRRHSTVVYPPVKTDFFIPPEDSAIGDYFLVVSRLKPHKRIDLAVKAFNQLKLKLIIVGDGGEYNRLKCLAGPNINFAGRVSDDQLLKYYQGCRALIFPALEDFGIAPVEAQACGRPVIAYGKGGSEETIVDGRTGILFQQQTPESLISAVTGFNQFQFESKTVRKQAETFDQKIFEQKFIRILSDQYKAFLQQRQGDR